MNNALIYRMRLAFVFGELSSMIRPRVTDRKKNIRRHAFDETAYRVFGIDELSRQVLYAKNVQRAIDIADSLDFDALFKLCDNPQYNEYFVQSIKMYMDIIKLKSRIQYINESNRFVSKQMTSEFNSLKEAYEKAIKLLRKFNGANPDSDKNGILSRYGILGDAIGKKKKKHQWDQWGEETDFDEYDFDIEDFDDYDEEFSSDVYEEDFRNKWDPDSYQGQGQSNFEKFLSMRGYSSPKPRSPKSKRKKKSILFDLDDDDSDPKNDKNQFDLANKLEELISVLSASKKADNTQSNQQQQYQSPPPQPQPQPHYDQTLASTIEEIMNRLNNTTLIQNKILDKLSKKDKKKKEKPETNVRDFDFDIEEDDDYVWSSSDEDDEFVWQKMYDRGERRLSVLVNAMYKEMLNEFDSTDDKDYQNKVMAVASKQLELIYNSTGVEEDEDLKDILEKIGKKFIGPEDDKTSHSQIYQRKKYGMKLEDDEEIQQSEEEGEVVTTEEFSEILRTVSENSSSGPENVIQYEPKPIIDNYNDQ